MKQQGKQQQQRRPTCGSIVEGGSSSAGTLLFSDAQLHRWRGAEQLGGSAKSAGHEGWEAQHSGIQGCHISANHRCVCMAGQRERSAPCHRSKVRQHAGAQAANDDSIRAQVGSLGADGLCNARRRAVHLEAQQQLLVLDAWQEAQRPDQQSVQTRGRYLCSNMRCWLEPQPSFLIGAPPQPSPLLPASIQVAAAPQIAAARTLELQQRHVAALQHGAALVFQAPEVLLGVAAGRGRGRGDGERGDDHGAHAVP